MDGVCVGVPGLPRVLAVSGESAYPSGWSRLLVVRPPEDGVLPEPETIVDGPSVFPIELGEDVVATREPAGGAAGQRLFLPVGVDPPRAVPVFVPPLIVMPYRPVAGRRSLVVHVRHGLGRGAVARLDFDPPGWVELAPEGTPSHWLSPDHTLLATVTRDLAEPGSPDVVRLTDLRPDVPAVLSESETPLLRVDRVVVPTPGVLLLQGLIEADGELRSTAGLWPPDAPDLWLELPPHERMRYTFHAAPAGGRVLARLGTEPPWMVTVGERWPPRVDRLQAPTSLEAFSPAGDHLIARTDDSRHLVWRLGPDGPGPPEELAVPEDCYANRPGAVWTELALLPCVFGIVEVRLTPHAAEVVGAYAGQLLKVDIERGGIWLYSEGRLGWRRVGAGDPTSWLPDVDGLSYHLTTYALRRSDGALIARAGAEGPNALVRSAEGGVEDLLELSDQMVEPNGLASPADQVGRVGPDALIAVDGEGRVVALDPSGPAPAQPTLVAADAVIARNAGVLAAPPGRVVVARRSADRRAGVLFSAALDGSEFPEGVRLGGDDGPRLNATTHRISPGGTWLAWAHADAGTLTTRIAPLVGVGPGRPWELSPPEGLVRLSPQAFLSDDTLLLGGCPEGCPTGSPTSWWLVRLTDDGPGEPGHVAQFDQYGAIWVGWAPGGVALGQRHTVVDRRIEPSDLAAVPLDLDTLAALGGPRPLGLGEELRGLDLLGWHGDHELVYEHRDVVWAARHSGEDRGEPRRLEGPEELTLSDVWPVRGGPPLGPDARVPVRSVDGEPETWVLDPAGGPAVRVTHSDGRGQAPVAWSPDGRWVVHTGPLNATMALYASRADGSTRVPLVLAYDARDDLTWVGWTGGGD